VVSDDTIVWKWRELNGSIDIKLGGVICINLISYWLGSPAHLVVFQGVFVPGSPAQLAPALKAQPQRAVELKVPGVSTRTGCADSLRGRLPQLLTLEALVEQTRRLQETPQPGGVHRLFDVLAAGGDGRRPVRLAGGAGQRVPVVQILIAGVRGALVIVAIRLTLLHHGEQLLGLGLLVGASCKEWRGERWLGGLLWLQEMEVVPPVPAGPLERCLLSKKAIRLEIWEHERDCHIVVLSVRIRVRID